MTTARFIGWSGLAIVLLLLAGFALLVPGDPDAPTVVQPAEFASETMQVEPLPAPQVFTSLRELTSPSIDSVLAARREVLPAELREPTLSKRVEVAVLSGFVRDAATNEPIPEAEIFVGFESGALDLRRVRAGPDGAYSLRPLEAGRRYRAAIRHGGLRGHEFDLEGLPPGETARDLTLDRSGAIRVLVLDAIREEPVSGVVVAAHTLIPVTQRQREVSRLMGHLLRDWAMTGSESESTSLTGSDGVALLPASVISPAQGWRLSAQRPGYFGSAIELATAAVRSRREIVLYCGKYASLAGRVIDARGRPLVGVRVEPRSRFEGDESVQLDAEFGFGTTQYSLPGLLTQYDAALEVVTGALPDSTTDALGAFRIKRVVRGVVSGFRISLESGEGTEVPWRDDGGIGSVDGIEIRVDTTSRALEGRMTVNGKPVRGTVDWRGATSSGRITADRNGVYRISTIAAGRVEVTATGTRPTQIEKRTIEVHTRGIVAQDFSFEVKPIVRGVVRDLDGVAASGVTLDAIRMSLAADSNAQRDSSEAHSSDRSLRVQDEFLPFSELQGDVESTTTSRTDGRFEFTVSDVTTTYGIAVRGPRLYGHATASAGDENVELVVFELPVGLLERELPKDRKR